MKQVLWFMITMMVLSLLGMISDSASQEKETGSVEDKPGSVSAASGEKWALLVGINQYQAGINPLYYSVADVKALYELLIDPSIGGFASWKVFLLTDNSKELPTASNIRKYLEKLSQAKAEDTVLIYFSGHGKVEGQKQYLLPIDTDSAYIRGNGISHEEFDEAVRNIPAKQVIVILDSCHSGGVLKGTKDIEVRPKNFHDMFVKESIKADVGENEAAKLPPGKPAVGGRGPVQKVALTSSRGDQESIEWSDQEHSVFTYYLLDGLKGKADQDNNGKVTFDELSEYVVEKVPLKAEALMGKSQEPELYPKERTSQVDSDIVLTNNPLVFSKLTELYLSGQLTPQEYEEAQGLLAKAQSDLTSAEKQISKVLSDLLSGAISIETYRGLMQQIKGRQKPDEGPPKVPEPVGYGSVNINAIPWAKVYLDGKYMGDTPLILEHVPVGKHELSFQNPNFAEKIRSIEVVKGKKTYLGEKLEAK